MSRTGRLSRRRAEAVLHRHETVEMEWAQRGILNDLVARGEVREEVRARTDGRCYFAGCTEQISAYPHAIPMWEGGTHAPVNRAGVCVIHAETVHTVGNGNGPPRVYLQEWLQRWYAERGMTPEQWMAAAVGQGDSDSELVVS